jgi:hypothetical protein
MFYLKEELPVRGHPIAVLVEEARLHACGEGRAGFYMHAEKGARFLQACGEGRARFLHACGEGELGFCTDTRQAKRAEPG